MWTCGYVYLGIWMFILVYGCSFEYIDTLKKYKRVHECNNLTSLSVDDLGD